MSVTIGAVSTEVNLNPNPAAPAGAINVIWQASAPYPDPNVPQLSVRDVSAYLYLPPVGGAVVKTVSYLLLASDSGYLLVFNNAGAITATLPAVIPALPAGQGRWNVGISNIGAGTLTIARNGKTIDGVAADLALLTGAGLYLTTDGTNYFTDRGTPSAAGGSSLIYHTVAAASTNAASIKASPGKITGWNIFNNGMYPIYVKLFDKASAPTPGVDTVVQTIGVQAGTRSEVGLDSTLSFLTGIAVAIVKEIADADATAIALNDCVADLFYT